MVTKPEGRPAAAWSARAGSKNPGLVVLATALVEDLDPLTDRLVAAILAEDPSYSDRAGVTREDLRRSCHDNLDRILRTLAGTVDPATDPFDAPRATAHRRAEQGLPLESVLHAYRVGFRIIWEGLVEQARHDDGGTQVLVEAATEVWEIVDAFSSAVADTYRETESQAARRDDRRRDALVDALLDGRGRERAVTAAAAAALDLPEHGRYLVAVLEGLDHGKVATDALSVRGLRAACRTRADHEVVVVALGRTTAADVVTALDVVPGCRGGLSPVVEGLAEVDGAHRLAETARRASAAVGDGLVELDDLLPGALLVTAPDLAGRLVRRALGPVLDLDTSERAVLLETLRAWLSTGGSAGQTAALLYCHRNTVLNRLRRLEALTGRSLERVADLVEWSLALLALDLLPEVEQSA